MTAFWIGLNYWVPGLQASSVPSTTVRLAIHIAVVLGLWLALERTELAPRRRLGVWLTVVVPYTLWLSIIWSAAIKGVFRPGNNIPPLVPLAIFLPVIVGVPILLGSKQIGELLGAMSTSWLINMELRRGRSTEMADRTASRIGGALLLVLAAYIGACGHAKGQSSPRRVCWSVSRRSRPCGFLSPPKLRVAEALGKSGLARPRG